MSDNKNLKLRFKLKELEFEIEGNEETVKAEFENFKGFVTNDILPQINKPQNSPNNSEIESSPQPLAIKQTIDVTSEELTDFPVMKQIVQRDLPKGEQEWVLMYAFYASNFGKKTFTRTDITGLYESSNRKTKNNMSSLSVQLQRVLQKGYIKFINDNDYIIKPEGISQAKLILQGKSEAKVSTRKTSAKSQSDNKSTTSKKSKPKSQAFKLDRNLNLRPDGKPSLMEFCEDYNISSTPERILVIVYYLKKILQMEDVNTDHIYTAFDKLNVRIPKSLYQLISDTKNKSGWLEFDSMYDIRLSIQGGNAMKLDLKKN